MKPMLAALLAALVAWPALAQVNFSNQGAKAYVARQDWHGLLAYATAWTRSEPRSAIAWYYLGTAHFTAGANENAIGPLERATALDPRLKPAWQGLGHANERLGRFAEAARAFQRCLDLSPSAIDYWNAVSAHLNAGNPQQARAILERERQAPANTGDGAEWFNIGVAFDALHDAQNAKAAYQRAVQLNPQIGAAWNNLGVIEQNSGNVDQALQDYRKAASLGEPRAGPNAQNLQSGLDRLAQQNRGSRQVTPQMVREFVRQGQAKAWQDNHPGSIAQPFGHP